VIANLITSHIREIKKTAVFSQRQFFIKADKMLQEQEQKCQLLLGSEGGRHPSHQDKGDKHKMPFVQTE
jgi:hypothetical protein